MVVCFIAVNFTWQWSVAFNRFWKGYIGEKAEAGVESGGLVTEEGHEGGNMARHCCKAEQDPQALC